jgi:hypothetical protein
MPPDKPLPLPDWAPPWWIGAGFIALWVGGFFFGLLLWVDPFLVLFFAVQTWQAPLVGIVLLVLFFWQRFRWSQRAATARALGLPFRPRVYESDLRPYRKMTLFALTDDCKHWAGYHHSGTFDGEEVEVFDYGFVGKFRTTEDRTVTWPGQQTVFLLPDAAGMPDFHLAPAGSDWGDLVEARLWSLDAGDAVLEVEMDDGTLAVLRGRDERAIKRLFRLERRDEMGLAPGWTIECRRGVLMLYRDRKVMRPEELARYLHQVIRIAGVLRAAACAGEPRGGPAAPLPPGRRDYTARLDDNVRPLAPEDDPS